MRGSIVKRSSGRYAVVLDNGTDPATGKRKQKWVSGFATKRAAEAALVDMLNKVNKGVTIDPDMTPFAEYVLSWLEARDNLAPLTVARYRGIIRHHIAETTLGATPIGKIRRSHIRAHEQELARKGLAASSRTIVAAVLSGALGDAVEDGLLSADPSEGRRARTSEKRTGSKFTVWTDTELKALLAAAAGDRLEALWRLAVASGARRGELLGSTWLGFSTEQATWTINEQVIATPGGSQVTPLKTKGSHRTIRLDAVTVAALEAHRERQIEERDRAGDLYVDRDLIFCDEVGTLINPKRLTQKFTELRAKAKVRPGRLHDVRHTCATHLLTAGVPVHIVSARLGHSSPMITLGVYAHVLPTGDEHAADVIAAVLDGRVSGPLADAAQT